MSRQIEKSFGDDEQKLIDHAAPVQKRSIVSQVEIGEICALGIRGCYSMPMPIDLEQEQLREIAAAEQFSFKTEEFKNHMNENDGVMVVLRAQLYLEHVLITTLSDALKNPEAVDLRRLNFPAKLNLCIAMGLISEELRNAATKINEMRNGAAHKLHVEFSSEVKAGLWSTMPQFLKEEILREFQSEGHSERLTLGQMFYGFVLFVDVVRQKNQVSRIGESYGTKYLRRVLDKRSPSRPTSNP
jgi:hypothetical protein